MARYGTVRTVLAFGILLVGSTRRKGGIQVKCTMGLGNMLVWRFESSTQEIVRVGVGFFFYDQGGKWKSHANYFVPFLPSCC